jgi:DNA-binding beta-propeller fold protein YncE
MTAIVNRRSFVKTAVAGSAAFTSSGPLILGAQDKAGAKEPIVGSGEHTYRCIHHWGRDSLPTTHDYGNASHGVTVDSSGMIYITHTGRPDSVYKFDPDGRFVKSMAGFHTAKNKESTTSSGHGIDIRNEHGEQFLYLAAANAKMSFAKMSLGGEVVWQRSKDEIFEHAGFSGREKLRFRPTNTSFRPDGGYYLGDGYGSNYLYEYNAQDEFVRAIGGAGSDDGQFRTPHGQWLDNRDGTPKLVVADRANARLQWFGMDGKHLRTQDGFLFPADVDTQGDLLLVPDLHARITILDKHNQPIAQLGDDEAWRKRVLDKKENMRASPEKWQAGRFVHPHDACFDADGNIFVAEWVRGGRVTKLVKV